MKMIAGACLRAVGEQVAHARRADADEHLHEVRAGDRDERHAGLTGDGAGDQRLAGARRTDEEHAARDARADLLELARVLQEVDDLLDLLLHRLVAGDVTEGRLRLLGVVHLGAALADVHDRAHLALGAAVHPDEEADEGGDGEQVDEDRQPGVRALADVVDLHALACAGRRGRCRCRLLFGPAEVNCVRPLIGCVELTADLAAVRVVVDLGDVALVHRVGELAVAERDLRRVVAADRGHEQHDGDRGDHEDRDPARPRLGRRSGRSGSLRTVRAGGWPFGRLGAHGGGVLLGSGPRGRGPWWAGHMLRPGPTPPRSEATTSGAVLGCSPRDRRLGVVTGPGVDARRAAAPAPIRWGLGDFAWAWPATDRRPGPDRDLRGRGRGAAPRTTGPTRSTSP